MARSLKPLSPCGRGVGERGRRFRDEGGMSFLDRPTWSREIFAGAVMALCAASATAVGLFFVAMLFVHSPFVFAALPAVPIAFFFGLWCGLIALLLFGAPGTLLLRWLGLESQRAYVAVGAASGLGTSLLAMWPTEYSLWIAMVGLIAGMVGGIVWWRSYRRDFQESEAVRG